MIVRLTRAQKARVCALVVDDPDLTYWLEADTQDASALRVDTVMPAIAWKVLVDRLFDECFNDSGFRRKVPQSLIKAHATIRRAVNAREVHPALRAVGMIGVVSELIPAWSLDEPSERGYLYSPYPLPGNPFVVLAPSSNTVSRKTATTWVEAARAPERPLLNPDEHWRFMRRPATPATSDTR